MLARKKILWVSHFLPYPAKGGAQIRSFNLIKQLGKYHDVTLFCLVHEDVVTNYFDSMDSAISASKNVFKEFCNDIVFIPMKNKNAKKTAYINSVIFWKTYSVSRLNIGFLKHQLKHFCEGKHFDSVHLDTLSLISLKDVFANIKVVLNHHNIESLMMYRRAKEQKNIFMKLACYVDAWKIARLERYAVSQIKTHIVCSDLDGDRLKKLFPEVITTTIPNGIDCSATIGKRNSDYRSILFIGGLDWYPNADAVRFLLAEVWPKLNKRNIGLHLDIIGKNPPSDIKEEVAKYSDVKLHGFVDDIAPYYEKAWLYVCPIRDGGGTKLKVLDAMANGVPLIAHPVAMEGIDASAGADYYQASDSQDFEELIIGLHCHPERLDGVGENGRKLIFSKYDYRNIGKKLAAIYDA